MALLQALFSFISRPSDVLIRGERGRTALVHGLLAEQLVHSQGLQTFTPTAQALERQIRNVWQAYDRAPLPHRNAPALRGRLAEMTAELSTLEVEYADWEVLYRQLAQLDRALDGEPQLIESLNTNKEQQIMNVQPDRPLSEVSTQELVSRLVRESKMLVRAEVALAKSELKEDLKREIHMVEGIGIAAVCGLITVNLLLVALVLGLSLDTFMMPGWAAALAVAAVVLVIGTVAGLVGWAMRVKQPLSLTRKTLKEDVQWAKERMA